eukprot:jgi/Bigna1/80145/fgenesh1_pg.68_\
METSTDVIDALLSAEETDIGIIDNIQRLLVDPLKLQKASFMTECSIVQFFEFFRIISKLTNALYNDLREANEKNAKNCSNAYLVNIISTHFPVFSLAQFYIESQVKAYWILNKARNKHPKIDAIISSLEKAYPEHTLEDILIAPTSRIEGYLELLKDMLEEEEDGESEYIIKRIGKLLEKKAKGVQRITREHRKQAMKKAVILKYGSKLLLERKLVKFGTITRISKSDRSKQSKEDLILFEDTLIVTRRKKTSSTATYKLQDCAIDDIEETVVAAAFGVCTPNKVFIAKFRNLGEKEVWRSVLMKYILQQRQRAFQSPHRPNHVSEFSIAGAKCHVCGAGARQMLFAKPFYRCRSCKKSVCKKCASVREFPYSKTSARLCNLCWENFGSSMQAFIAQESLSSHKDSNKRSDSSFSINRSWSGSRSTKDLQLRQSETDEKSLNTPRDSPQLTDASVRRSGKLDGKHLRASSQHTVGDQASLSSMSSLDSETTANVGGPSQFAVLNAVESSTVIRGRIRVKRLENPSPRYEHRAPAFRRDSQASYASLPIGKRKANRSELLPRSCRSPRFKTRTFDLGLAHSSSASTPRTETTQGPNSPTVSENRVVDKETTVKSLKMLLLEDASDDKEQSTDANEKRGSSVSTHTAHSTDLMTNKEESQEKDPSRAQKQRRRSTMSAGYTTVTIPLVMIRYYNALEGEGDVKNGALEIAEELWHSNRVYHKVLHKFLSRSFDTYERLAEYGLLKQTNPKIIRMLTSLRCLEIASRDVFAQLRDFLDHYPRRGINVISSMGRLVSISILYSLYMDAVTEVIDHKKKEKDIRRWLSDVPLAISSSAVLQSARVSTSVLLLKPEKMKRAFFQYESPVARLSGKVADYLTMPTHRMSRYREICTQLRNQCGHADPCYSRCTQILQCIEKCFAQIRPFNLSTSTDILNNEHLQFFIKARRQSIAPNIKIQIWKELKIPIPLVRHESLSKSACVVSFGAEEVIIAEGDRSTSMYIVVYGQVKVTVGGKRVRTLESGDILGEIGLLVQEMKRTASCIAVVDTVLFQVDQSEFFRCINDTSSVLADVELRLEGLKCTIRSVLHHAQASKIFKDFLDKEYAGETYEFWMEVREFRKWVSRRLVTDDFNEKTLQEKMIEKSQQIVAKYIGSESKTPVNISMKMEARIKEQMMEGRASKTTFLEAEKEALTLMKDKFFRFKMTKEFKKFFSGIELYQSYNGANGSNGFCGEEVNPNTEKLISKQLRGGVAEACAK